MTNIAQHLPEQSKTIEAIYAHYKKTGDAEPVRGYLGASIIGHPCERYLWYCFRQCYKPDFSGRMYRLFETGNLEEARFVRDLQAIGCEVHTLDEKGEQFAVSALGGHFSGHLDGCALGIPEAPKTWHVLEFKTHGRKSFLKLVANQNVKKSHPQHYAQVQIYMHLSGMKRALYLAVEKDTDTLYSERIRYDKDEAEALMQRAERVITAQSPSERISERPDFYQCSWCDARNICWGTLEPEPALPIPSLSCRQCCHATPITREPLNGRPWWHCEKQAAPISCDEICKDHLVLSGLITFAEPTNYGADDTGQNFIEFTNRDGTKWLHGNGDGCYSSEELRVLIPASCLGNKTLQDVKDIFGAKVTDCEMDILQRYPESDSRIVWKGPSNMLVKKWRETYSECLTDLTPIGRNVNPDSHIVELPNGRIAILWTKTQLAEIREGVE